jgi:hypothetical protein
MLNLFIGLLLLCFSFGVTLSKTQTKNGIRKHRQHVNPLSLDREVL